MAAITADVLNAILAGTTRITRRCEIFERDAATVWLQSAGVPRLIDGSISVDYSRAERRVMDNFIFDNADGVLDHAPGGFWYDKIIKCFRGIEYTRPAREPRIALLWDNTGDLTGILRNLGYTNIDTFPEYTGNDPYAYPFLSQIKTYDIAVAGITLSTHTVYGAILGLAFEAGVNVFSYGDRLATHLTYTAPWYLTGTNVGSPVLTPPITKAAGDHIFRKGWDAWTDTHSMSGQLITGIKPRTVPVALHMLGGTTVTHAILTFQSEKNTRWFHNNFKGSYNGAVNFQLSRLTEIGLEWVNARDQILNWETQVGEFMIDDISEDNFPRHLQVTGRDYTSKLLGDKFANAVSFNKGASLDETVRTIATNGGITKFRLGAPGTSLAATATFDRTADRWTSLDDMCAAHNTEIFFSPDGYLVTRPFRDPVLSPATLTLSADSEVGNLVKYNKKSSSSRIYNEVVVTGENPDDASAGQLYQGIARNTLPSSPTSIVNFGRKVTYFYTSTFFTSNAQCLAYAQSLLQIKALEDWQVSFSSLVFPWLEAGDIFVFEDPRATDQQPDRFLFTNFSIPMSLGPMDGAGKRITIVGDVDAQVGQGDEAA